MKHTPIERQVLPFRRRWHVIDEIDLAPLLADHAAVRRMCQQIEDLADQLTDPPGFQRRFALAEALRSCIQEHVRVTSTFLERAFAGEPLAFGGGVLSRILLGQISDAVHADDVIEALQVEPLDTARIDMLSYMLRCLFDSYRRAVDFEELALLTLAGARLSSNARRALEHSLELAGARSR